MKNSHYTAHIERWGSLLLLAAGTIFILWAALLQSQKYLNDDMLITLTFVKNILSGNGFVFNHPPAILGTTTPLYTLIMVLLGKALPFIQLPVMAVFFSALSWASIPWVLYFFADAFRITRLQAVLTGLIVISSGWNSLLGMEAYLFAFLLVLCAGLFFKQHWFAAGAAGSLLFLTRGEGALLMPVLVAAAVIEEFSRTRAFPCRLVKPFLMLVLGFGLPLLFWFGYAYTAFGDFLPNTLGAKIAQGDSGRWVPFLKRMWSDWMPGWGLRFAWPGMPFVSIWWALVAVGLWDVITCRRRWLVFLAWAGLYIGGYSALGVPGYYWYQFPIYFLFTLVLALGMIRLGNWLAILFKRHSLAFVSTALLAAVVLLVQLPPLVNSLLTSPGDGRGESYTRLGAWFREHAAPSESVAYIEIGYLGYYSRNRVVDLAGLISPQFSDYIAQGDFASGFWDASPDFYVHLPDFDWALANIRSDARFDAAYQPVDTLPGPWGNDIVIYQRISTASK